MVRVIFSIQHPAHVHLFRNAIRELQKRGDEVKVYARENELVSTLLECYDIEHEILAPQADSIFQLAKVELSYEYRLTRRARVFDPDVMVAVGGVGISRPAMLTGAKCLIFADTEHAKLQNMLAFPFADQIYTPECYRDDINHKQIRYPGYHELAYLHPDRFQPNPDRLRKHGINIDNTISVVRFVGWNAHHDIGQRGFSLEAKQEIVSILNSEGDVYVSSEGGIPEDLQAYELSIPPFLIHELLAEANYYIGESGTMATEAAVLGTPAIRCNSFVESDNAGVFCELENEYSLLYSTSDEEMATDKLEEFISNDDIQREWNARRDRLLDEKCDTTKYIIEEIRKIS